MEALAKRLEPWKVLVSVAVGLVGAVLAFASWEHTVAKMSDVDEVKKSTRVEITNVQAGTTAQLGALQVQGTDTRERLIRVEATVADLADEMHFIRAQLTEIAKATGAKAVKEP